MNRHPASTHPSLRTALRANALFSLTSGLVFVLAARPVAGLAGISPPILSATGILLVGFAGFLLIGARQHPAMLALTGRIATILDWAWVAGTLVVAVPGLLPITDAARTLIVILAGAVAAFAVWQQRALRGQAGA